LSIKRGIDPPRVLLDAKIILSYFLPPIDPRRTIFKLIDLVLAGSTQLVLPEEVTDEVMLVVRTKPYFRQRMTEQDARGAIELLGAEADVPPRLADTPGVVRDPKDDYLIAHAILGRVDFLVTGDHDLLALDNEIEHLRIITAAAFLQFLDGKATGP
jgi:putative PIN family toxin of toxin-antitoxin system